VHVTVQAAGTARSRAIARYLGLYPRSWRERYGEELADLLDREALGLRTRLDLVRGAVDAHLHPATPSPLPVLTALTASALATAHALAIASQPVATEWPGYLDDALPLITGSVAAMIPALIGLWLKLGDDDGPLGRVGVVLGVVGATAWLLALLAAAARVAYGPATAAAATVAMAGTAVLGVALFGRSRVALGVLVAAAGSAGVAPPALAWPAFAAAWTGVAVVLVLDYARRTAVGSGIRHAG